MPNGAGPNGSASQRPKMRPELSAATIVLPTGQRVKRHETFGRHTEPNHVEESEGDDDEETPLLGEHVPGHEQVNTAYSKTKSFIQRKTIEAWDFATSKTGKGVFKCSVAYVLGSMATFVPPIYHALGKQEGKHIVATITVYYHPARSMGSTFEALICSSVAFAYTAVISFSSMGVSIFFGRVLDSIVLGHIIVLVVFCGAGLGFIGWVKQRMSHPVINISCSLSALTLITLLTYEGSIQASKFSEDKVVQQLVMLLMGVAASTFVSFTVFPVSARKELRSDFVKATSAFGDMLAIIAKSFVEGSEDDLQQETYKKAMETQKKVFTSMTKYLKESRYEHYFLGTEKEYHLEAKIVKCMQRLAQSVGGLRSAATTQFLLLSEPADANIKGYQSQKSLPRRMFSYSSYDAADLSDGISTPRTFSAPVGAATERNGILANRHRNNASSAQWSPSISDEPKSLGPITCAADIFTLFIMRLGPAMKSLAITMVKILDELPFDDEGRFAPDNHFTWSLEEAVRLYNTSRQEALESLYKTKEITQTGSREMHADLEEVAASCGYFSFNLQDFASEMKTYLEILDELKLEVEERPNGRTWNWLRFWRHRWTFTRPASDSEHEDLVHRSLETDVPGDIPSPTHRKAHAALEKSKTKTEAFRYRLWRHLRFFRRDDVKFAIKVGVGAALYALPSYLQATRHLYIKWRGHWGLLSYILVCTMTLGASNTTGWHRFIGTIMGACLAVLSWTIAGGSPYILAFFGWVMAYWTAYIVLAKGQGPFGRFIVLTYNLSALYAYSVLVQDVDKDFGPLLDPRITQIASHRTVAVISGCIWGLIVTRLIWPISARTKVKDGLSLLWLRMGLIWKRDPLNMLLAGASPEPYLDLREEFDLQKFFARVDNLRKSAVSELDLRGPFPDDAYGRMLKSTGAMLDTFHAMNVMIMKNPRASKGEAEILKYTANERDSLCTRISHLFQVMASSMKLEFPMNGALPSIGHTRDRLLAKIFHFRQEEQTKVGATDEDFELLYAYALVTGQLAEEIKKIGTEIEQLFGVLNEDLLKLQ